MLIFKYFRSECFKFGFSPVNPWGPPEFNLGLSEVSSIKSKHLNVLNIYHGDVYLKQRTL